MDCAHLGKFAESKGKCLNCSLAQSLCHVGVVLVPLLLLLRFSCPSQLGEGVLDSLRGVTQALPTCGPDSCTQFSGDTGLHGCGVPCLATVAVSLSLVHQGVPSYLNQLIEPTAGKGAWGPNDGTAAGLEEPRRNLGLAGLSPPEPPPQYSR